MESSYYVALPQRGRYDQSQGASVWGLFLFPVNYFCDWLTKLIMHSEIFFTLTETSKSGFDSKQTTLVPETHISEITSLLSASDGLLYILHCPSLCAKNTFFFFLIFLITPINNFGLPSLIKNKKNLF